MQTPTNGIMNQDLTNAQMNLDLTDTKDFANLELVVKEQIIPLNMNFILKMDVNMNFYSENGYLIFILKAPMKIPVNMKLISIIDTQMNY